MFISQYSGPALPDYKLPDPNQDSGHRITHTEYRRYMEEIQRRLQDQYSDGGSLLSFPIEGGLTVQEGFLPVTFQELNKRSFNNAEESEPDQALVLDDIYSTSKLDREQNVIVAQEGTGKSKLFQYVMFCFSYGLSQEKDCSVQNMVTWTKNFSNILLIDLAELGNFEPSPRLNVDIEDEDLAHLGEFIVTRVIGIKENISNHVRQLCQCLQYKPEQFLFLLDAFNELPNGLAAHVCTPPERASDPNLQRLNNTQKCMLDFLLEHPFYIMSSTPNQIPIAILNNAHRRFELLGYDQKDIELFVENFFHRPMPDLVDFLKEQNHFIYTGCSRIFLEIICLTWLVFQDEFKNIKHDINPSLLFFYMAKYCAANSLRKNQRPFGYNNSDVFIAETRTGFDGLMSFSLTKVKSGTDLVLDSDFQSFGDRFSPKFVKCMGVICESSQSNHEHTEYQGRYVHSSIRDFFAACALIVNLANEGTCRDARDWIRIHKYESRFRQLLGYAAGLIVLPEAYAIWQGNDDKCHEVNSQFWGAIRDDVDLFGKQHIRLLLDLQSHMGVRFGQVPDMSDLEAQQFSALLLLLSGFSADQLQVEGSGNEYTYLDQLFVVSLSANHLDPLRMLSGFKGKVDRYYPRLTCDLIQKLEANVAPKGACRAISAIGSAAACTDIVDVLYKYMADKLFVVDGQDHPAEIVPRDYNSLPASRGMLGAILFFGRSLERPPCDNISEYLGDPAQALRSLSYAAVPNEDFQGRFCEYLTWFKRIPSEKKVAQIERIKKLLEVCKIIGPAILTDEVVKQIRTLFNQKNCFKQKIYELVVWLGDHDFAQQLFDVLYHSSGLVEFGVTRDMVTTHTLKAILCKKSEMSDQNPKLVTISCLDSSVVNATIISEVILALNEYLFEKTVHLRGDVIFDAVSVVAPLFHSSAIGVYELLLRYMNQDSPNLDIVTSIILLFRQASIMPEEMVNFLTQFIESDHINVSLAACVVYMQHHQCRLTSVGHTKLIGWLRSTGDVRRCALQYIDGFDEFSPDDELLDAILRNLTSRYGRACLLSYSILSKNQALLDNPKVLARMISNFERISSDSTYWYRCSDIYSHIAMNCIRQIVESSNFPNGDHYYTLALFLKKIDGLLFVENGEEAKVIHVDASEPVMLSDYEGFDAMIFKEVAGLPSQHQAVAEEEAAEVNALEGAPVDAPLASSSII